jgi:dTMP kinase
MNPSNKGLFVAIEGIEGAGKSTAIHFIQAWLAKANISYILTREPGGTEIAENIRALLLLKNYQEKMCADTELLLMFASRAQHLFALVVPALARGDWVICDRFTDATYAYQGGGRGVPVERIAQIEHWVQGDLRPDHVILLDLPAELGMQRLSHRQLTNDRIEQEKISFFERARAAYLAKARAFPEGYTVIDASQALEKVQANIEVALLSVFRVSRGKY